MIIKAAIKLDMHTLEDQLKLKLKEFLNEELPGLVQENTILEVHSVETV